MGAHRNSIIFILTQNEVELSLGSKTPHEKSGIVLEMFCGKQESHFRATNVASTSNMSHMTAVTLWLRAHLLSYEAVEREKHRSLGLSMREL